MADTSDCGDTCVVCFKTVEYYSIGQCDHPVCYECSTRMRVLCLQNECPICRQILSRVVFTDEVVSFESLRSRPFSDKMFERQYKISFCSDEIKKAYERILEHRCKICKELFRTFEMLNDHMRRVHEKFYCDLCVKHLKIFSSERKCYNRQELAHHRRKGDLDDTSHRGHPLCQFCEVRFMDNDELYRHLRKEHLYCHLCDADGCNQYYASHDELATHFRSDHFLCEEGECAGNHLTSVFRTEIDLKAHKAQVHGRGMPRAATRQARTLELQFNVTPHPAVAVRQQQSDYRVEPGVTVRESEVSGRVFSASIDTRSEDQFPTLSAAAPAPPSLAVSRHYQGSSSSGLARTKENFPALDGGRSAPAQPPPPHPAARAIPAAAVLKTNGKPGVSIPLQSQPGSASNFRLTGAGPAPPRRHPAFVDDEFPTLSVPNDDRPSLGAGTLQPPKVSLVSSEQLQALKAPPAVSSNASAPRARLHADSFPALGPAPAPAPTPQWITVSKPKEKPKSKVAPAPKLPQPAFNPVADFPQLSPKSPDDKRSVRKNGKVRDEPVNSAQENSAWAAKKTGKNNKANKENREAPKKVNGEALISPDSFPELSRHGASGLTFTNSSGETFSAPVHNYIPPPDFEKRNVELVKKFARAIGPSEMEKFKNVSRSFRTGNVSAGEFYEACKRALKGKFDELFPEMVALLPDIGKQQALVAGAGKGRGAWERAGIDMCAVCGQLLLDADTPHHRTAHWPTPR